MKGDQNPLFLLTQRHQRRGALQCHGIKGRPFRCIPPLGSEHLRKLETGGWIDWARGWVRSSADLLIESDPASPSAEFVHFDHMSGRYSNRRMSQHTASGANPTALGLGDEGHAPAIGERVGAVAFLTWRMVG